MRKWDEIKADLDLPPDKEMIRPAQKDKGIYGPYLPAQVVVMYLNQVFGPDAWSGTLNGVETLYRDDGTVVFLSRYEIFAHGINDDGIDQCAVRANGGVGVAAAWFDRESQSWKPPKPNAIDTAYKAAISDGLKRTAKDFGPRLGMRLYLNETEIALFSLLEGIEHSGGVAGEAPEPAPQVSGDDEGPFINPKKAWKDDERLEPFKGQYGKVRAGDLLKVFGDEAIGYLDWLWPKMEASEKEYDQKDGKLLKAWLDLRREPVAAPKAQASASDSTAPITVKGTLIALLRAAKDDVKVTPPIVGPLKKMLNDAGYENDFHIRGLVKQVSGDEQLDITKISVKQAKSLMRFADFLANAPDNKDEAKEILALAWARECPWNEAEEAYRTSTSQKPVDMEKLVKEFNPKMSLKDIEPVLHGFGWPVPIPEQQLKDYLAACKKAGCNLFDETATAVAKAVAVQWSDKK